MQISAGGASAFRPASAFKEILKGIWRDIALRLDSLHGDFSCRACSPYARPARQVIDGPTVNWAIFTQEKGVAMPKCSAFPFLRISSARSLPTTATYFS